YHRFLAKPAPTKYYCFFAMTYLVQYGSLKTDPPPAPGRALLAPPLQRGDKNTLKVPLAFGGCEGDLQGINMLSEPYWFVVRTKVRSFLRTKVRTTNRFLLW
ncbi:hypothetical protein C7B67_25540, partial [filamentous cyanobacterium Phorm 6]